MSYDVMVMSDKEETVVDKEGQWWFTLLGVMGTVVSYDVMVMSSE